MREVYKLTFISGKVYIGISKNSKTRLLTHIRYARNNGQYKISYAIRKYDVPKLEILESNLSLEEANFLEIYYIKSYNSFKNGYNLTLGGDGCLGYKQSLNTRLKRSKALKGKKAHPNSVKATKFLYLGKHLPQNMRNKIANTLSGKTVNTYKNGHFVGSWNNLNTLATELNLYRGNITHCLKGKLKSTGGYTFKYKDET